MWFSTGPGCPMKFPKNRSKKPPLPSPMPCQGWPKAMLKPKSTQTIRTTAKAENASIMLFTDHRFCMTPP